MNCPRCKGPLIEFVQPVHMWFCHWCEYVQKVETEKDEEEKDEVDEPTNRPCGCPLDYHLSDCSITSAPSDYDYDWYTRSLNGDY